VTFPKTDEAHAIELLVPTDEPWVARLWRSAGVFGSGLLVRRALNSTSHNEFCVGVREKAFAHYRVRKDGVRVLYEIAVDPAHKRHGIGRALIAHLGVPVLLKTDADNVAARSFYERMGMRLVGQKVARNGKLMVEYVLEQSLR
jgi:ribosomal protein S18 acetylase RimI-like enzyme